MNQAQKIPGVLAFQGDIEEHLAAFNDLGIHPLKVKTLPQLKKVSHLVIPGGESTVIGRFLSQTGLGEEIIRLVKAGRLQIYGTCAGAILLSREVESSVKINNLQLIDVKISRNAYGSQINSFSAEVEFFPNQQKFTATFIRAPKVLQVSSNIKILSQLATEPILLEQENVLISTFHPELQRPSLIHAYFMGKDVLSKTG